MFADKIENGNVTRKPRSRIHFVKWIILVLTATIVGTCFTYGIKNCARRKLAGKKIEFALRVPGFSEWNETCDEQVNNDGWCGWAKLTILDKKRRAVRLSQWCLIKSDWYGVQYNIPERYYAPKIDEFAQRINRFKTLNIQTQVITGQIPFSHIFKINTIKENKTIEIQRKINCGGDTYRFEIQKDNDREFIVKAISLLVEKDANFYDENGSFRYLGSSRSKDSLRKDVYDCYQGPAYKPGMLVARKHGAQFAIFKCPHGDKYMLRHFQGNSCQAGVPYDLLKTQDSSNPESLSDIAGIEDVKKYRKRYDEMKIAHGMGSIADKFTKMLLSK